MKKVNEDDEIGKKYGKLTIIKRLDTKERKRWIAKCECGNIKTYRLDHLHSGAIRSCGCIRRKYSKIEKKPSNMKHHGFSNEDFYGLYKNMIHRCYNENATRYDRYGGRGITVCDEWKNNIESFKNWALKNGYEKGLSIERIDVNGNYEPSNCTFIPLAEQSYNTTRNIRIEHDGKTKLLEEWCRELGLRSNTISSRVKMRKISYYDALFNYSSYKKGDKTHCINGHEYTQENTKINNSGYRTCKICANEKAKISKKKARENKNDKSDPLFN